LNFTSLFRDDNVNDCKYGRIDTGEIGEFNSRTFGISVGSMRNPSTFGFRLWPVSLFFVIRNRYDRLSWLGHTAQSNLKTY